MIANEVTRHSFEKYDGSWDVTVRFLNVSKRKLRRMSTRRAKQVAVVIYNMYDVMPKMSG